jgi:hypothetical protein
VRPLPNVVRCGEADTQFVEEVDVQQDAACFLLGGTGLLTFCY